MNSTFLPGLLSGHLFEIVDESLLAIRHLGIVLDALITDVLGNGFR